MRTPYSLSKRVYHGFIPEPIRAAMYRMMPVAVKRFRRSVIQALEQTAEHDDIYDARYYATLVDPTMQISADTIARSIVERFQPRNIIDVGCGTGLLLCALKGLGVEVRGLEYSQAGIDICRRRGLEVMRFDIERDAPPPVIADVVVSTEVAEHLPASCADRFVDLICHLSANVVLTAAEPSAAGDDHVNEQPKEYWIAKFEDRHYQLDVSTSESWRAQWRRDGVAGCFASTVMVFRRIL